MRTNYASSDCAAAVVYSHNAQNPGDVLKPDRDSYLLYECTAADKSIHIQLCQDILVDSLAFGNYEMFSSQFRHIKIYATDRYAHTETNWSLLGSFTGEDERVEQLFTIEDPHMWASHIRIDFQSHWGAEFYCPINTIAVYGTTMLDKSKTILTPGDLAGSADGLVPAPDPCNTEGSPLEQQQCCRPRPEGGGSISVYEAILNRIITLENQNKKTGALLESMNATAYRETHQLQKEITHLTNRLHHQQQTIAFETLLLMLVIGYSVLQLLSKFRMSHRMNHSYSESIALSKNPAFLADETLPLSPPLFSPASSPSSSAIPSPSPESVLSQELEETERVLQLAAEKALDDRK